MRTALLLLGFAVSLGVRVVIGGDAVAQSVTAGLVFAAALLALSVASRTRVLVSKRALLIGVAGVVLVCLPVALEQAVSLRPLRTTDGFATWALAVTAVAVSEEVFLRGALYESVDGWRGPVSAVAVGAVCFALLHVPLYGWHVVPLDLAVGVVLGGLRHASGTPLAPAVTHAGADLVGWFVS